MGKLRERMERDLEIRGFSPNSRKAYLYRIKALARYFGRSPDRLSPEEIQRYQLHLTRERKVAWLPVASVALGADAHPALRTARQSDPAA